jgi:hypothetical protein
MKEAVLTAASRHTLTAACKLYCWQLLLEMLDKGPHESAVFSV